MKKTAALLLVLLLGACAPAGETLSEGMDEDLPADTTEDNGGDAEGGDGAGGDADAADDGPPGETFELDPPTVYKDGKIRLAVTQIRFISRQEAKELDADYIIEDNAKTLVVATFRLSNDSGQKINLYPNQGTLQIGREQRDADLFNSTQDIGGEFNDGVDEVGQVLWQFRTAMPKLLKAGEATYSTGAPHESDNFSDVGEPVDLTIEW